MEQLRRFIERVRPLPRLVIQAHDFPDHDAVAASFALSHLLRQFGVTTRMVYNGVIDRVSLSHMIDWLEIDIVPWTEAGMTDADKNMTVDGCMGEKNVRDLPGEEIAVVDHHQSKPPPGLWFSDVRPTYGATATIVYEYYRDLGVPMPQAVATALQVGQAIDTANLTRGFCAADIEAFAHFHQIADQSLVARICRNSLMKSEVRYYEELLKALDVHKGAGFVWLERSCPKNMLGMMGDFLLSVEEIHTTILAAPSEDVIQMSLRTEHPDINVGQIVREVLQQHDLGFGGGHRHMAGGLIKREKFAAVGTGERLFELFRRRLP